MFSFSPEYNSITVSVMEKHSDSMHRWEKSHDITKPRMINLMGYAPFSGMITGAIRGVTAVADIVMGLFLLIISQDFGMNQVCLGVKNLARTSLEVLPTISLFAVKSAPLAFGIIIGVPLFLMWRDQSSFSGSSSHAPVALYHDNVCVKELNPQPGFHYYTTDQWLEQLEKYGIDPRR